MDRETLSVDCSRMVIEKSQELVDCSRMVIEKSQALVDCSRLLVICSVFDVDTLRVINYQPYHSTVNVDVCRMIYAYLHRYKQFSINMQAKAIAPVFQLETFEGLSLGKNYIGQIYNYFYDFAITELDITDGLYAATGNGEVDEILNLPLVYSENAKTAISIMQETARIMGLKLNMAIEDFNPLPLTKPTGKEVITELFDWTEKVPRRQVIATIANKTLDVIQRGKENKSITITKAKNVKVHQEIVNVLKKGKDSAGNGALGNVVGFGTAENELSESERYISGTFSFGGATVTYVNGLVVSESHSSGGETEATEWYYDAEYPPAKIRRKVSRSNTRYSETSYYYSSNGDLVMEFTEEEDIKNKSYKRITTRHYPLGQDLWATVVIEDGEVVSENIGRGAPAGDASAYAIRTYSAKTDMATSYYPEAPVNGQYLGEAEFPVSDKKTLQIIASELNWMQGKTFEKVSLDAYCDEIITFWHKVVWQGTEYFLETNIISDNPKETIQSLTLVRWF